MKYLRRLINKFLNGIKFRLIHGWPIVEGEMKVRLFYIIIGLMALFSLPTYSMYFEEEVSEQNPNCQMIFQRIKRAHSTLEDYNKQNGKIPIGEKYRYEEYLRDLVNLYNQAQNNKEMKELDIRQELYTITNKYF